MSALEPTADRPPKVLADDTFTYTFNAADQLTAVSWQFGTLLTATYHGDDRRIRKNDPDGEVVYIRNAGGNVLAEYDGSFNLLAEYIYANGRQVARGVQSSRGTVSIASY